MFLEVTKRRNPELIKTAINLHQEGIILPDTYVLDLDTIEQNVRFLKKKADENNLELFYMTKQIGRNPLVAKKIQQAGIEKAVVVDYKEALTMMEHNLPIGNVGHLVQIPLHLLKKIISYGPDYITVFSIEMLININRVATEIGRTQKVLLKVIEAEDNIYEGQFGGFHLNDLPPLAIAAKEMTNVIISGLTSFPCFLFDGVSKLEATRNIQTINEAKNILKNYGIIISELNIPSATCGETIPLIESIGGTQGEPGHALTGTTPLHAKMDLDERPAMVYVSEVSHNLDNKAYFYGGGYYRRGHLEKILISDGNTHQLDKVAPFGNDSIDYYLNSQRSFPVGSTVIAAFRTQIFVTRSDVAVVSGISKSQPQLEGIYNSLGNLIRR